MWGVLFSILCILSQVFFPNINWTPRKLSKTTQCSPWISFGRISLGERILSANFFSILLAWNRLETTEMMTNLVNLYLIPHNRTVTGRGCTKQKKQVAGFEEVFNIFKTQRDHLMVAKTYLMIPPTLSISKR